MKIKAYQTSSILINAFHEKNQKKYGIGFDYEAPKDKRTPSHKSKNFLNEKGPQILKNVSNPIFKKTIVDFDEEFLGIKQQLLDEDNQEKCESFNPIVEKEVKINTNVVNSGNEKIKAKKKKANKNRKVGINKSNNYVYVKNAPRKIYLNCGSSNHLTHMCKKPKNEDKNEFKIGHQITLLKMAYPLCDNFDYMPCKMNVIASYFHTKRKFVEGCISKNEKSRAPSILKTEKTSLSPKSSEKSHKT